MAARVEVVSAGATVPPAAGDALVFGGIVLPALQLPFTFRPARPLTDEELLAFAADNSGVDFEVDADGTVTVMIPSKPKGSRLNQIFAAELTLWARRARLGEVFGPDLGVRFDDGVLRSPDAAWLSAEKWRQHNERAGDGREYLTVCPEFVAELRSPGDRASKVEAKMEFWMSRGAELGWLIDPARTLAMIYTPGAEPRTLLCPEFLEGSGPIAGFRIEMREFRQ
jgi:Uma2 family endonuclease